VIGIIIYLVDEKKKNKVIDYIEQVNLMIFWLNFQKEKKKERK
jgi:hypothetical protein